MFAVILADLEDPVAPLVFGDVVADEEGVSHDRKGTRVRVR
jgi:isopentenyl phosphate kinase